MLEKADAKCYFLAPVDKNRQSVSTCLAVIKIESKNGGTRIVALLKQGKKPVGVAFDDKITCTLGAVRFVLDIVGQNAAGTIELNHCPQHSQRREIVVGENLIAAFQNRRTVTLPTKGNLQDIGGRFLMDYYTNPKVTSRDR